MKILLLEAELFHANRERDRGETWLRYFVAFPSFANKPNKVTPMSVVMILSPRFICRLQSILGIPRTFEFTGFSPWKRLKWRRVRRGKGALIITGHWPTTFVTSGATCSRRRCNRQNIVDTVGLYTFPGGKSDYVQWPYYTWNN